MSDIKKGYTFTDKSTDWVSNKETAIRLNKMLDDAKLNLVAGTNITITPTANGPSISASGGGTGSVTSIDVDGGTGISVSPAGPITTAGTFTVTNTAPDQVVSLTGAGTTTVTGTYPSFTISSADSTTGTVTSVAATAGTGITVSGSPITTSGTLTITNSAPDQTVSLTGAGTTVITGTYPSFTVTSNDAFTGTVTSVAATAGTGITISGSPITSSGTLSITNSAPDQVVSLTGTGTTTVTGTYPSFTINSADQHVGTVTAVTGTLPIVSTGGTTPAISINAATISASGSMSAADKTKLDGITANQTEKTFFAGPTSGSAAAPTFRVIASTDLPAFGSGDVAFAVAGGAGTIAANAVTNAKAAQMATQTIKGRTTGGTGNAEDLTATQATAILNPAVGATVSVAGTKGLVPAPAIGDQVKFLRGDMTYQTVSVPISVSNRAALRAYTGAVDKQFIVEQGYYSEGDGGGGLWHFMAGDNNSVDNDGTLVVPGGSYGTVSGLNGCWHRDGPGTARGSIVRGTKLDVRWFGAIPNKGIDCATPFVRAFDSLKVFTAKLDGTIYAPAGYYAFYNNMLFDVTGLDIKTAFVGDGPSATVFYNSLTTAGLGYFMKFVGFDNLTLSGFTVQKIVIAPPTYNPDAIIHIKNGQSVHVNNVDGRDNVGTTFLWEATEGGAWLQMAGCKTYGTSNVGTQLKCMGGAGTVTGCSFKTSYSTPCLWVNSCNSIQISDSFFEGGGPWKSFSSNITGSGSAFTVNATAHGFRVGDYIVISSSTVAGYNGRWKVATVAANSLTVTSAVTGSATATLGTLWSCGLLGGTAGGNVTESSIDNCLFNTSGSPGTGSVGLYLDGRDTTSVSGIRISQCTWDYGVTGFFAHGITNQAVNVLGATVYNSNVSLIYVNACGPNGGPRDEFGAFRLEGVTSITINDCACFPTDNNPPGTGKTFNSLVISDGGQAYYTQDISITGGTYTVPYSSTLFPSASIYAFVFDGSRVRRVNISGVGIDTINANAYVSSLINGASISNGISVVYSNSSGALNIGNTNILSGTGVFSITQTDQAKLVPELGYGTSGTVDVRLDLKTSNYIGLVGNTTFTFSGIASGSYIFLALKNTTGGSITLSWPAINWASVSTPTSLAAGDSLLLRIFAFGTAYSDTFASY